MFTWNSCENLSSDVSGFVFISSGIVGVSKYSDEESNNRFP